MSDLTAEETRLAETAGDRGNSMTPAEFAAFSRATRPGRTPGTGITRIPLAVPRPARRHLNAENHRRGPRTR